MYRNERNSVTLGVFAREQAFSNLRILYAFARHYSNTKMNFSKRFPKFQVTKCFYAIITIKHGFLID